MREGGSLIISGRPQKRITFTGRIAPFHLPEIEAIAKAFLVIIIQAIVKTRLKTTERITYNPRLVTIVARRLRCTVAQHLSLTDAQRLPIAEARLHKGTFLLLHMETFLLHKETFLHLHKITR